MRLSPVPLLSLHIEQVAQSCDCGVMLREQQDSGLDLQFTMPLDVTFTTALIKGRHILKGLAQAGLRTESMVAHSLPRLDPDLGRMVLHYRIPREQVEKVFALSA